MPRLKQSDPVIGLIRSWIRPVLIGLPCLLQQSLFSKLLFVLFFLAGIVWTGFLYMNSSGMSLDDEITHAMIARDVYADPPSVLYTWGRPLNTLIYLIPSYFGLDARRLWTIGLSCLTVLLTTLIAYRLKLRFLFLVPLFLWFQPWFNRFGFQAITEIPLGTALVLSILCWQGNKLPLASILFGSLSLIRHEAITLSMFWFCYLFLAKRNIRAALLTTIPLIIYNLLHYYFYRTFAAEIFFDFQPSLIHGHGDWFHFVRPLTYDVGPIVLPLALLGIPSFIYQIGSRIILFLPFLIYFLTNTVIYRFGLFESGGYPVFIQPIAPAFSLLAIAGFEYCAGFTPFQFGGSEQKNRSWQDACGESGSRLSLPKQAFLLCIVYSILLFGSSTPILLPERTQLAMLQAVRWLEERRLTDHPVYCHHVWFEYYYKKQNRQIKNFENKTLKDVKPGEFIVWDDGYMGYQSYSIKKMQARENDLEQVAVLQNGAGIIFQKRYPEDRYTRQKM